MKHTIISFFAFSLSFFACQVLSAQEVWKMEVKGTDGTTTSIPVSEIENVTFVKKTAPAAPGEAIDLGLSVKWASCNIGASKPEEYGDYYAWGETEVKSEYSEGTYKYFQLQDSSYVHIGNSICGTQYDVAHVKWGGSWRMPSFEEVRELYKKCSWEWTTSNGVTGCIVTGPNGNSIFLPATGFHLRGSLNYAGSAGFCWSGTLNTFPSSNIVPEEYAYAIFFDNSYNCSSGYGGRFPDISVFRDAGLPVRPVSE